MTSASTLQYCLWAAATCGLWWNPMIMLQRCSPYSPVRISRRAELHRVPAWCSIAAHIQPVAVWSLKTGAHGLLEACMPGAGPRNEPRVCDTGGLVWRLDEDLVDATTKRQYAAIDDLPNLRRFTEAELRLRSIILGSPEVPHMHGRSTLIFKPRDMRPHVNRGHIASHTGKQDDVALTSGGYGHVPLSRRQRCPGRSAAGA